MRNKLLVILFFCVVLIFAGCIPSHYTKGVDADEYPDRDLPVYDDAIIFEYEEDDDEVTIKYGTEDDVDDVMDFYQDYFKDEEIALDKEDQDKDEYQAIGFYEDFLFEIDVEEARGKNEEKVFNAVVEVEIEFLSKKEIEDRSQATREIMLSNARIIISSVEANNALAWVDDTLDIITYDMLMSIETIDEFNSICEIDVTYMNNKDFNITKGYIQEDSNGYLILNGEYDHTK